MSLKRCRIPLAIALAFLPVANCLACPGCVRLSMNSRRPFDGFCIHILSIWLITMVVWWVDAERPNARPGWRAALAGAFIAALPLPWNLLGLGWLISQLIRGPAEPGHKATLVGAAGFAWSALGMIWLLAGQNVWAQRTDNAILYIVPNLLLSAVCFFGVALYSILQIRQRSGWLWRPLLAVFALSLFWLSDIRDGLAVAIFYSRGTENQMIYDLHATGLGFLVWLPAVAGCYLVVPEVSAHRWRGVLSVVSLACVSSGALFAAHWLDSCE